MKRLIALAAMLVLAGGAAAAEPRVAVLEVSGMVCPLCPISVRKALERVPGVIEAKADLTTKHAEAKYDPDKVTPDALVAAVNNHEHDSGKQARPSAAPPVGSAVQLISRCDLCVRQGGSYTLMRIFSGPAELPKPYIVFS